MEKTLIGAYIKQQREDRGWTQNFLCEGICSRSNPLPYRKRHPGSILRRLEKHSSLLLKMPICSITAPGPQEFPAARGRGDHFCSLRYRLTRLSSSWRVSSSCLSPAK